MIYPYDKIKQDAFFTPEMQKELIRYKFENFFDRLFRSRCFAAALPVEFRDLVKGVREKGTPIDDVWVVFIDKKLPVRNFMRGVYMVDHEEFRRMNGVFQRHFEYVFETSTNPLQNKP